MTNLDLMKRVQELCHVMQIAHMINQLSELSSRQSRVLELRVFGGMSVAEAAQTLEVSERTVKGDWKVAKAWLRRELRNPGDSVS